MILDIEVPYDEDKVNRIYLNISSELHVFIMGMFYNINIPTLKSYYEELMETMLKCNNEGTYVSACDISKNIFKIRDGIDSSKVEQFRFLYVEKNEDGKATNIVFQALLRT